MLAIGRATAGVCGVLAVLARLLIWRSLRWVLVTSRPTFD